MKKRILFYLFVLAQVLFLLGMMGFNFKQIQEGYPVKLSVVPRDPDNLMRGEYAYLNYDVETIDLNKVSHDVVNYQISKIVYITLGKDTLASSDSLIPVKVNQNLPPASEFPFIKGEVIYQQKNDFSFEALKDTTKIENQKINKLIIKYPINQYFVQEGRAKEIESLIGTGSSRTTHRVQADVRLAKDGTPYITGVFIDGKLFK